MIHAATKVPPTLPDMPGDHRLAPLVAEAFKVFAMPRPDSHGVCRGCCLPPALEAGFHEATQREVPADFIAAWFRAKAEPGLAPEEVGWLMPRIMELAALGRTEIFTDPEFAFHRLAQTGFPMQWPPRAVDVFQRYSRVLFRRMVLDGTVGLDATIAMFANSGLRAPQFLDILWALDTGALSEVLHRAWCGEAGGRIWQTPLWIRQADRVRTWAWYLSDDMVERMIEAARNGDAKAADVAKLMDATLKGPGVPL